MDNRDIAIDHCIGGRYDPSWSSVTDDDDDTVNEVDVCQFCNFILMLNIF